MKKDELLQWMDKYDIKYSKEKKYEKNTLFALTECPFCDGAHNDGAYIMISEKGYVTAGCHHDSCQDADFKMLYKLKTGEELVAKKSKKKPVGEGFVAIIDKFVEEGKLEPLLDEFGNMIARIKSVDGDNMVTLQVRSFDFRIHIQSLFCNSRGFVLEKKVYDEILDYISILAYKRKGRAKVYKRICNTGDKIVYELDKDTNKCVVITKNGIEVNDTENVLFYHSKYYSNQVEPRFDEKNNGNWKRLVTLVKKHFNFADKDSAVLFTLYLVSCFLGTRVNHFIMSISGPHGSGKSSLIRRFSSLVDPKGIELGNIPKREDDLSLKISESYVSDFDNLSYLNKDISNLFCKCSTGGTNLRRTLYENTDQTIFALKSVVVLDGIDVVINSSDLIERTLFFELKKLGSNKLKTEEVLNAEFENDVPEILGLCFSILQLAMCDNIPITTEYIHRMADSFEWFVRIARTMGYDDEYVVRLLKDNQRRINYQTVTENPVSLTLLSYMEYYSEKSHTVTDLYKILKKVGSELQVDMDKFPKSASSMSRKINQMRSNLEMEGITYNIDNKGYSKVITIKNAYPKRVPVNIS